MNFYRLFFFFLVVAQLDGSYPEYIYPVGPVLFEGEEKLCLLYQQGIHLELLLWNPTTHTTLRGLSHFVPAGLTILPSKTGFSFIDHERIRIKMINKRSPKTIDLYPLYDFGALNWIDDENFYCSAREGTFYHLFHITEDGDRYRLTKPSQTHYTYPQKVGSDLFYIKRDKQGTYTIEKTNYPEEQITSRKALFRELESLEHCSAEKIQKAEEQSEQLELQSASEILLISKEKECMFSFLTMLSSVEGYVLKHAEFPFTNNGNRSMVFICWHLIKKDDSWRHEELFSFEIPMDFLYGEKRLYESILRLLPLYKEDAIYFVTMDRQGFLDVQRYGVMDRTVSCSVKGVGERYNFTPCLFQGQLVYGGMVQHEQSERFACESGPTICLTDQGEQLVFLPILP